MFIKWLNAWIMLKCMSEEYKTLCFGISIGIWISRKLEFNGGV